MCAQKSCAGNTTISTTFAASDTSHVDNISAFGIILLGNTGVGKSFLANILLGREAFEHKCSPSSVTHATEFQSFTVGQDSYAIFNIPGLIEDDQAAVDLNKEEIYKAFQQHPNSVVAFVFNSGSSGRIRDEDLVAFNAIHKSFDFKQESLVLIVNDLPLDRPKTYEGETTIKLERLVNIPNVKVVFLDRIDTKNGGDRDQLCMKLVEYIMGQCKPKLHKKHADIQLRVDVIKQLKMESKQQQENFEKQIFELQGEIARKQLENDAENKRIQEEYENLKKEMADIKERDDEEKLRMRREWDAIQNHQIAELQRMQRELNEMQNRPPPQIIHEYIKKKRRGVSVRNGKFSLISKYESPVIIF